MRGMRIFDFESDSIFGFKSDSKVPQVNLGVVGTSNAGKTYLLHALQKHVLDLPLASGLELGATSGRDTTELYRDVGVVEQEIKRRCHPRSRLMTSAMPCLMVPKLSSTSSTMRRSASCSRTSPGPPITRGIANAS